MVITPLFDTNKRLLIYKCNTCCKSNKIHFSSLATVVFSINRQRHLICVKDEPLSSS